MTRLPGRGLKEFQFTAVSTKSVCSAASTIFVLIVSQQSGLNPRVPWRIIIRAVRSFVRLSENVWERSCTSRTTKERTLISYVILRNSSSCRDKSVARRNTDKAPCSIQGFCIIEVAIYPRPRLPTTHQKLKPTLFWEIAWLRSQIYR